MPISGYPGQVISATAPTVSTAGATGIWTLDEQLQYAGQNLWPGYQISRSVRLRMSASAYFNRTTSSSNRRTMTFSFWMKRGVLTYSSNYEMLFSAYPGTSDIDMIGFSPSSDSLRVFFQGAVSADLVTTQVFRDPSAWYHIVVAIDTTQATSSDRVKIYLNGSQITSFSTSSYPSLNYSTYWNAGFSTAIGANLNGPQAYFDGYLTEINFIDGQALTPSSFGVTSAATGVWGPIKYTGTYGTNGFYLNFSDNSSNTATTIGKDSSGNGNNWTPNNISVTAGSTYDSMVDVPVGYGSDTGVGGEVRGNYGVMNFVAKNSRVTSANGNLQLTGDNTSNHQMVYGTFPITSGKWYWEVVVNNPTTSTVNIVGIQSYIGFADGTSLASSGNAIGWGYTTTLGNFYSSNFTVSGSAPVLANGTIGIAYDADAGKIWFRNTSGSWVQGDPAAGTSPTGTLSGTATTMMPAVSFYNSNGAWSFNFGQQAFSYTAPSGYKALCTQNLSTPTIVNGASYMAASLYTGTGAALTVANTVNGTAMQPGFLWLKNRSLGAGGNHVVYDVVRGGPSNELYPNLTNAESTSTGALTSLNSNGFTLGNAGDLVRYNSSGNNYVAWQWTANGTGVSNTSGSITSTVSVNTTSGFSIVGYTGTGANATVGHGLGVAPSMIITKVRSTSGADWNVYHTSIGATASLFLDLTSAASTSINYWNNTSPTSSVFSVGISGGTNNSGNTMIAYCFAAIAGYSAFGSYTGNGSTDGPFIYTGFRPRFILYKPSNVGATDWVMWDTVRSTYNVQGNYLLADTSGAEGNVSVIDILSNGFKLRVTSTGNNGSGDNIVYAAFAENPFKFSLAR